MQGAKKIIKAGKPWYKHCAECGKRLESTTRTEKEGEIYGKGCYIKKFGGKGFGHGQGAWVPAQYKSKPRSEIAQ